ncbi:MAG: hypothetical protein KF726_26810 [Anaerolineae bacterium]|nr:hypothetical protein [Anaerolineae bacterium]
MADITFEELVEAAQKLPPAKKAALLQRLTSDNAATLITRESVLQELTTLREAGAFRKVESLRGVYARPDLHIEQDELEAHLREVGKKWENDIDDLFNSN